MKFQYEQQHASLSFFLEQESSREKEETQAEKGHYFSSYFAIFVQKYGKIPHQAKKNDEKYKNRPKIQQINKNNPFNRKKIILKQGKSKTNKIVMKIFTKKNPEKLWGIVGNFIIFAPKNKY